MPINLVHDFRTMETKDTVESKPKKSGPSMALIECGPIPPFYLYNKSTNKTPNSEDQ